MVAGQSLISPRFTTYPPPDPMLPYIRKKYVELVAANFRRFYKLHKWVTIAAVTNMNFEEYKNMDDYTIEALYQECCDYVKVQNEQQQKSLANMTKQIESMRQMTSAPIQTPRFPT
jgi:hypothetical protein